MFKKIMLSCYKATELVEKSNFSGLSAMEKIRLRMHLSVCDACKKYQKQSALLNQLLTESPTGKNTLEESEVEKLNDTIIKKIEENKTP